MSSLKPDFDICQTNSCTEIQISETTRAFNSLFNQEGWGSPNISYTDSGFEAIITIVDKDENSYEFDVTEQITNNNGITVFTPFEVEIPDGAYTITYTITTDTSSVSTTKKFFSYCSVKCCVYSKISDSIDKANCNCDKDLTQELYIWGLYKSMIFKAGGCNFAEAEAILAQLELICESGECNCN